MAQRVLLAHSGDWIGVSRLPRLFRRAGARTTLFGVPGTLVSSTRDVDEFIAAPPGLVHYVIALRRFVERRGEEFALVVLADDALVAAVAQAAGEDWIERCLPVDRHGPGRPLVASKFAFLAAARAAGLPVPGSAPADSLAVGLGVAREFGYPVMLKRDSGSGGTGVRRIASSGELAAAFDAWGGERVCVEEVVDGVVGGTEALFDRGRPLGWWSFEKRRRYPAPFGPSTVRRLVEPPAVAATVRGYGALTGFHGFVAMCWIFDERNGRFVLLEVNPRPGSGMHLRPAAERIFAPALRTLLAGRRAGALSDPAPGTVVRMFPQDLERAIVDRDVVGMLAWIPGLLWAADVPWDDPGLLRAQGRYLSHACFPRTTAGIAARYRNAQTIWHKGA